MNDLVEKLAMVVVLLSAWHSIGLAQTETNQGKAKDPWEPVRFLVGEWEGVSKGQAGNGTATRSYSFVLKDRFLHDKNVSTYPPHANNKEGEIHEHQSFFSYDRIRKAIVLRQFHQEGFVNQYVLSATESRPGKLVFASENFENFDNKWKARETNETRSPNEFVETFELAAPGKEFEVYSRTTFKRAGTKK